MKPQLLPAILCLSVSTLLSPTASHAEPSWITGPKTLEASQVTFTREFEVSSLPKSATLKISTTRNGNVSLNGKPIGASPGLFDLTPEIKAGKNTLQIAAAEAKGNRPQAVAILTLQHANGSTEVIESGEGWLAGQTGKTETAPAVVAKRYEASNDVSAFFPQWSLRPPTSPFQRTLKSSFSTGFQNSNRALGWASPWIPRGVSFAATSTADFIG